LKPPTTRTHCGGGVKLPVEDLKSFWGALGCACWAV